MATGGKVNKDIRKSPTRAENGLAFKEIPKEVATVTSGKMSVTGIIDLLECPICMNTMFYPSPIHQCSNGHTICFKCKSRVRNTCPTCRKELGNIRCIALEKVAELLGLPCKFSVFGCQDMYPYENRARHEQSCRFGFYNCPYTGGECRVTGDVSTLVTHLKEDHGVDMRNASGFNHRYIYNPKKVEKAVWTSTIFNCFGHHFCLHSEAFKIQNELGYMAFMHFMGEKTEATKFNYCLELGVNGKKVKWWQGNPRSIRDSHETVRDSPDRLFVSKELGLQFSGDGQELKLNLSGMIWRKENDLPTEK